MKIKNVIAILLTVAMIFSTFVYGNTVVTSAQDSLEEVTYASRRTMFKYKKSNGYSACLYQLPTDSLEAGVEYTIKIISNIAQGSSGVTLDLYGIDKSITNSNDINTAINARPSSTSKYTNRLRSTGSYGQVSFGGSNKSYNRYREYTFTLTEEEAANKKFYLGYSFLGSGNAVEIYISEFSLYKSGDETKTSLLGIDNYSTDIDGWCTPYGQKTTLGKYVEYDPSYFTYMAHFKYTGSGDNNIGCYIPSVNMTNGIIKKNVKYTISYDYYFINRGFDYGVYPMLFGSASDKTGLISTTTYYDRVYSLNYNTSATNKTLFGDKVGGVYQSKNGHASYTFTITDSQTLRDKYYVGFLLRKNTSWTSNPEFYISNLKLTAEGSDKNLLPVDEYQYSFNGAGENWKENYGWIKNSGTGFADSNYVPYGTGDGNIDGEVDIRDLVTADETITATGFNPFLDTNVDRTIDENEIKNLRYQILGLGIIAPRVAEEFIPTATRTASKKESQTVMLGETVTYTVDIKNTSIGSGEAKYVDAIPKGCELVSGDGSVVDGNFVWKGNLDAGETKTITYTIKLSNDKSLYGTALSVLNAKINDNQVEGYDLYIERTAGEEDQRLISNGIRALKDSTYRDMTLANWIYQVAFSKSIESYFPDTQADTLAKILDGTASETTLKMVVPTLYGGTAVKKQIAGVRGEPCEKLTVDDLVVGDILFVNNGVNVENYIYDKDGLVNLSDPFGAAGASARLETLPSSTMWAVFRPTINVERDYIIGELPELELTAQQKAVIATAENYLLRGEKIQYDAKAFGGYTGAAERMTAGEKSPEDYTTTEWGYSNCAGFTYDTYYNALGVDINYNGTSLYYTVRLENYADKLGIRKYNFTRTLNQTHTAEEMAQVKQDVFAELKPADIILVRRNDGTGHALLYAGNGTIIHSTGSSYDVNVPKEIAEPTIRYHRVEDYLFTDGSTGYIFGNSGKDVQVDCFMIIRPLDKKEYNVQVPEETQNRVENLQGIMAEKVSSHNSSMTVNKDEIMTFTFKLYNTNDTEKTVAICDTVPQNTTYVSGAESVEDNNLSWNVTIPANSKKEITYKVRVNSDAAYGDFVESYSTVGGVKVNCPKVYIKRSLTALEQQEIVSAINTIKEKGTTKKGLALVNEIYKEALGVENAFESTDFMTVTAGSEGVFSSEGMGAYSGGQLYKLNSSGKYLDMMAPTMFGGRRYYSTTVNGRTFLARKHNLMVGDILLRKTSSENQVYMYTGEDNFAKLTSGIDIDSSKVNYRMETCLSAGYYYVVLRPSYNITIDTSAKTNHLILNSDGSYGGSLNEDLYGKGAPLNGEYDVENSDYYTVNKDYYNMKCTNYDESAANNERVIFPKFASYQQTMQDSSGIASLMMVLNFAGEDVKNEYSEYALMERYESLTGKKLYGNGISDQELVSLVNSLNLGYTANYQDFGSYDKTSSSSMKQFFMENIKAGKFVLVRYQSPMGFGWKVVIGYDSLGQVQNVRTGNILDSVSDDVIIFAEPNDGFDHQQDGYATERFSDFHVWWLKMATDTGTMSNKYSCVVIDPNIDIALEYESVDETVKQTLYDIHLPLNPEGTCLKYDGNTCGYGGTRDYELYGSIGTGDGSYNHTNSNYYKINDFYNMGSLGSRVLLSNYTILQQTMGSSCGICATNSVLSYYGHKDSQYDLELKLLDQYEKTVSAPGSVKGNGTNVRVLYYAIQAWGYKASFNYDGKPYIDYASYMNFMRSNLESGKPIVVNTYLGSDHAMTVIGLDDMGTDYIYDDVVIIADSSDYWDGYQDGYVVHSAYKFFTQHTNKTRTRLRNYLVIEKP